MRSKPWLARRLVIGAALWIALSIGAGGIFLSYAFQNAVQQSFDAQLTAQARSILAGLEALPTGDLGLDIAPDDPRFSQVFSGWYWQVNQGERPILRSRSLWDTALPNVDLTAPSAIQNIGGPRSETLRSVALNARLPGSEQTVTVVVAVTLAAIDPEIAKFNLLLFAALGLLAIGLVIAIILQVWLGLRPLRRLTQELAGIRNGEAAQLGDVHPREIEPLVQAFNDVRAHDLQTLARARKEAGNLAHALKMPLARLAADVSDTPESVKKRIADSISELKSLIDLHTARASTAAARGVGAKRILVRPVIEEIVSALRKIYAEKPLQLDIAVDTDAFVLAEDEDLSELLGNVLDNAFKWAAHAIRVSVQMGPLETSFVIADDGPGMPDAILKNGVRRGQRLDESVPGSGLGLSIALDLAEAYGGALELRRSQALGGLEVEMRMPLTAAATKPRA